MKQTNHLQRERGGDDIMQRAMGRGGQEAIVREALERVDGKPTPTLDPIQVAMSSEAQIRLVHDVVRSYLDEHGHADTREWVSVSAAGGH